MTFFKPDRGILLFFGTDDPYYCGLRARIPNFAKSKAQKEKEASRMQVSAQVNAQAHMNPAGHPMAAWHGMPAPRGLSI